MPRIRTIKPEFWDSPGTARASLRARLFYIALWNWADDYGVGTANPKQLIGFAFPNDDDMSVAEFPRLRTEVSECYGTVWYEVDGRPFYAIPAWDDHQKNERRARGKYPRPDQATRTIAEKHGASAQTHGASGTGTGEQGNRGTGEQGNRSGGGVGNSSTESDDHREILAAAGLSEDDARRFLIHLRSNGITKPPAFVKEYARAGKLRARIEEWIEECEAAANAPRVIQANVTKAKRVRGKANYDVEVCEAHGSEASTCPMCRAGSKESA
jgi:hypothetical protein